MKVRALIFGALLLALPALGAHAQTKVTDCPTTEYAELKDTPKDELIFTYCLYGRMAKIDDDAFHRFLSLDVSKADDYRTQADQCRNEQLRIAKVLRKAPDCDALRKKTSANQSTGKKEF
jgi:hypothetical protein